VPLWQQLAATATALQAVRAGQSATTALDALGGPLRPGVQALLFQVLRHLGRAQALRRQLAPRNPPPRVDALLCTALALAWDTEAAPYEPFTLVNQAVHAAKHSAATRAQAGFVNACLRRFLREREALVVATQGDEVAVWNHPAWWIKRLQKDWPEHWQAILMANQEQPPLILRVNRRHGSRDDYLAELRSAGIDAEPCTFSRDGVRLLQPCDVKTLPGFAEGRVSVQDEAAQLAADLLDLAPGQRVLDACAAPGGKTCHLLEAQPQLSEVIALDLEPGRLARVQENLERLQLKATLIAADGRATKVWWDGTPFQRILLDAPCSATGVIRRHPDIKLTRQADDIAALAQLQGELLDALWPTLEVGGVLLYATCSVLPQENSDNIAAFLQRTPGARELDIAGAFGLKQAHGRQLLPQADGHDGFYYAKLIKIAASPRG